jgi:hypothetical protein
LAKRSTKRGAKDRQKWQSRSGSTTSLNGNVEGELFTIYWHEEQGKRIQKAYGYKCENKRSAVAYLEQLLKVDLIETRRQSSLSSITVKDFAKDMFTEGAPHLARWAAKGKG